MFPLLAYVIKRNDDNNSMSLNIKCENSLAKLKIYNTNFYP